MCRGVVRGRGGGCRVVGVIRVRLAVPRARIFSDERGESIGIELVLGSRRRRGRRD